MKYIVSIGPDHFEVNEQTRALALAAVIEYVQETGEAEHMIGGLLDIVEGEGPTGLSLGEVQRTGF